MLFSEMVGCEQQKYPRATLRKRNPKELGDADSSEGWGCGFLEKEMACSLDLWLSLMNAFLGAGRAAGHCICFCFSAQISDFREYACKTVLQRQGAQVGRMGSEKWAKPQLLGDFQSPLSVS